MAQGEEKLTEIRIGSLGEFVDRVTPDVPDPRTGRRRDTGIYRGAADAGAALLTSLDRLGGTHPPHSKSGLEEHALRNYLRYARPYLGDPVNHWEALVSAEHHGVPTRLLDWTYSPLVAAYFATRPADEERDRAVWRLDWQRVHRAFGFAPLALLISDLQSLVGSGEEFTPWKLFARSDHEPPFACAVEPPSLDHRIVAQAAVFTLCSDCRQSFDAFLRGSGLAGAITRYVIPARDVSRIRDQLDLVGVDERRLFPDLDGVAAAIRRYYT